MGKPKRPPSLHALNKREAQAYVNMLHHCYNEKHRSFHRYGGKGIKVCDQWLNNFPQFLADVGKCPTDGHYCLGRLDPSKDFQPGNAKWLLRTITHGMLRHDARIITFQGQKTTAFELARQYSVPVSTIRSRWSRGVRGPNLVVPPTRMGPSGLNPRRKYGFTLDYQGQQVTLSELEKISGIPYGILWERHQRGNTGDNLVRPVRGKR